MPINLAFACYDDLADPTAEIDSLSLFSGDADTETGRLEIDLKVQFQSIPLPRDAAARYYLGCTEAAIAVLVTRAKVLEHQDYPAIPVSREIVETGKTSVEGKVKPTIGVKAGDVGVEASIAEISVNKGRESSHKTVFQMDEQQAIAIRLPNDVGVKWVLAAPRGKGAFRDYLAGPYGFGSTWDNVSANEGYVKVRHEVRFFSLGGRAYDRVRSWLMSCIVWGRDGIDTDDLAFASERFRFK